MCLMVAACFCTAFNVWYLDPLDWFGSGSDNAGGGKPASSLRHRIRKHPAVIGAPTRAQEDAVPAPLAQAPLRALRHGDTDLGLTSHVVATDHLDDKEEPDPFVSNLTYHGALALYARYMNLTLKDDPHQETKSYVDVEVNTTSHGVELPHDPSKPGASSWRYCDPRNASFSFERDQLCAEYLSDWNNMRAIRAQPSRLLDGRTLKFKIFYRHGNLTTIVKISQKKFFFEAVSEMLAYHIDRALNFSRVPTTAFVPLPLDYLRAAAAWVSPFYTQWFDLFVPSYDVTKPNFVMENGVVATMAAVQVWMVDVHSALMGYLAVNYEQDDYFFHKFLDPADPHKWPPRPHRLTAIGDLCDRFIFDFIIGNTDRGMNDHNNFVYGGCDERTACTPPADPRMRTLGPAKYAFIDHGSSFYSHREPEGSPFTGNATTKYIICRFRRSTYDNLRRFVRSESDAQRHVRPLVDHVLQRLPKGRHFFNVVRKSVFKVTQDRLEKIVRLVDDCVAKHGAEKVFSL